MCMYKTVSGEIRMLCCVFVNSTPCVSFLQIDVWHFLPVESCFVGWRLVGCCSIYHITCLVNHVVSLKLSWLACCCNLWNTFWLKWNNSVATLPTGLVFLFLLPSWVPTLDLKRRYWLFSVFFLEDQYKVYYSCYKKKETDHQSELVSVDLCYRRLVLFPLAHWATCAYQPDPSADSRSGTVLWWVYNLKGVQSQFAHIEKFSLNFSNSLFVIRFNLLP